MVIMFALGGDLPVLEWCVVSLFFIFCFLSFILHLSLSFLLNLFFFILYSYMNFFLTFLLTIFSRATFRRLL